MKNLIAIAALMMGWGAASAAVIYSPPVRNQNDSVVGCQALNTGKGPRTVKAQLYEFDHTLKHEGQLTLGPGKSQQVAFTSEQVFGAYCKFTVPTRKIRGYITLESVGGSTTHLIHEAR
jgi:hypothetical protein